jgi:general secretion pathway protein E
VSIALDQIKAALPQARQQAIARRESILVVLAALLQAQPDALVEQAMDVGGARLLPAQTLKALTLATDLYPANNCRQHGIAVARSSAGEALLLMPDPWDDVAISRIARQSRHVLVPVLATPETISALLDRFDATQSASARVVQSALTVPSEHGGHTVTLAGIDAAANPVVRFVDALLFDAWRSGASDVHFETTRQGLQAKLRLDGVLVEAARFDDVSRSQEVISRIKVLASLDIAETRIPQDGRFRVRLGDKDVDFRVSIMPSTLGEDAVLRLLDKSHLLQGQDHITLESLGLAGDTRLRIRQLANEPHGMLLVTGPTGSGKTTTLYAVLSEVNTGRDKIITIEDPVEYELPGVLQIPVNEKKGLTFAKGLRSILRHDPDRILVGEIRDGETAEIAVQAALTGHMVFTTVHANNAFDVLGRFIHLDIDLFSFASAVNGVVAQRLIRLNCPHCAAAVEPSQADWQLIQRHVSDAKAGFLTQGTGCEQCRGTGYKGRTAIAEVLPFTDPLREKIAQRAPLTEIKALAEALSGRSLLTAALDLVAHGQTTIEEVSRVVSLAGAR